MSNIDRYNLQRFLTAQESVYTTVLAELRAGRKRSHWIWFIFPQIDGLGFSATSKYYAIKSADEARDYLAHPLLGSRLIECSQILLEIQGRSASAIFGFPDDLKLRSCMTLFASISDGGSVFAQVLEYYFQGQRDQKTIELLKG